MAAPRKIFRIEETIAARREPSPDDTQVALGHAEIAHAVAVLRAMLEPAPTTPASRTGGDGPRLQADQVTRIAHELDAVVTDSETATQKIIAAAEDIDQVANTLSAALKNATERGLAQDIRDRVIQIFEACNFQDLASQRVTKVTATLAAIEEHVLRAIDTPMPADAAPSVHGPRLLSDRGHVTQAEIDAMFRRKVPSA
jgi:hypothetical protein